MKYNSLYKLKDLRDCTIYFFHRLKLQCFRRRILHEFFYLGSDL